MYFNLYNKNLVKKIFSVSWIAIGILSILFAIISFTTTDPTEFNCSLDVVSHKAYGGDAYTGIQQAAADTANNLNSLNFNLENMLYIISDVCGKLIGFVLLIAGFAMILVGATKLVELKTEFVAKPTSSNQATSEEEFPSI